ncbi:MAG: RdgB/HAM1 family non-canonical purine NTP pyrophosphatase [Abditibacteriales bacterium]|nr:RdgB/HAM1 family non-canonical purine NTP pyrophosphatase [Abditibacteriales bacterium]MDW8366452.1 RdgB/HAM1 family non-canonical purine NTP pyrophosphatase [Abditibacteriales bacterium]
MNPPSFVLLLATSSHHKLREIAAILDDLPVELKTLRDLPHVELPPEDFPTMRENAIAKAVAAARQSGIWALADDSGLEVDALGGAPGVYSRRFLGDAASDADRNTEILRRLQGVPDDYRTARYRCAAALASPDGTCDVVEATCEGVIAHAPVGSGGFGYDPIFFLPELGVTMAQLPLDAKNRISHRGRAMELMKPLLWKRIVTTS